jgi:Condensation domain/Phosphopantetheine attachment site
VPELDDLERAVLQIFRDVLPHADVAPDEELLDLGGQSLEAAQIAARISNRLGIACAIHELMDAGTPRRLASVLFSKLLSRLEPSLLRNLLEQLDGVEPDAAATQIENREQIKAWAMQSWPRRAKFVQALLDAGPTTGSPLACPAGGDQESGLSFAQQRFWSMQKLATEHPFLHYTWAALLTGEIDPFKLELVFNLIRLRHNVVRMSFREGKDGPRQTANINARLELEMADFSDREPRALEMALADSVMWAKRPFRFGRDLLLRTRFVRLGPGCALLVLCGHVVVSDGWSKTILLSEAASLYRTLAAGRAPHANLLPLPAVEFTQFAQWERENAAQVLEQHSGYWTRILGNLTPPELPYDFAARGRPVAADGGNVRLTLSREMTEQIRSVAHDLRVSTTAVTLAAFLITLRHWSGQDDVVVQFPIPNRRRPEFETVIGCFTETALLRESVDEASTFADLALRVAVRLLEAIDQAIPFEALLGNLWPSVERHDPALFPVMFAPQPAVSRDFHIPGLHVRELALDMDTANFPLHIYSFENDSGLDFVFRFATNAFQAGTIQRMAKLYQRVLECCLPDAHGKAPLGLEA